MSTYFKEINDFNFPIKAWIKDVELDQATLEQLEKMSKLDFLYSHLAIMPDAHMGKGATVGTVIATENVVIPSAVGVDIGCGMNAVRLSLKDYDLPDSLYSVRRKLEKAIPVGREEHSRGSLLIKDNFKMFRSLEGDFKKLIEKHPSLEKIVKKPLDKCVKQLGTLGSGNHFIELCIDENHDVWIMLHSGSRHIGGVIGNYFIEMAKKDMRRNNINLPDVDLAYLKEGSEHFDDYRFAVSVAQEYSRLNRKRMMDIALLTLRKVLPDFVVTKEAINCHHNYISWENHFGKELIITRKGAVNADYGQLGIIPGSMGAKSFIVRGKGNAESFCSCSHGAGRVMSRSKAKKLVSLEEHINDTKGIECRKDMGVIDETPKAYKDIDKVMSSQEDLVEVIHTLKQLLCIKGS